MLISCVNFTAFAEGTSTEVVITSLQGEGTENSPYLISNLAELKWFRDQVDLQSSDGTTQFTGKYFKLTNDINLDEDNDGIGENWNPIGSMSGDHGSFKGIFDGDGHTISNLYVETAGNGLGLFARTAGNAVIKNLTIKNATLKSTDNSNYLGAVVANSYASTKIENVHVTGKLNIEGRGYLGGISGHGYVVMNNCSVKAEGTIKSSFWCVGGILGYGGEGATNITNSSVEGIGEGLLLTSAAGGIGSIIGMAEDNNGTQPISGSNLSAKNVDIKTYVGGYGTSYAEYALGYLYGGNPTSKLTGTLEIEDVTFETSTGNTNPPVSDAVASINSKVYFSLADALAAAKNGDTVTVIENIELDTPLTVAKDKNVTLDLNGKTVIYNSTTQGEAMITNKGVLTINDSVGNGEINYNYTGAADSTYSKGNYTISNAGNLTVNGGKITIANLSGHAKYPIDNNSTTGDAVLIINGGHLYNYNTSAIRQFCNSTTYKNSVTINGGLIEGYSAIWVQNPSNKTVNGSLSITGGEIKSTAKAYVNGTAELKDVSSKIYCTTNGGNWSEDSKISITGGTINENVYLAEQAPADIVTEGTATYNGYVELPTPIVTTLPDAEVKNLGSITVKNNEGDYKFDGSYYVYDLLGNQNQTFATSDEAFDMQMAMEFIAKDTREQAAANIYGNYTTDFFIKITGLKDGSFVGDGCYLAGYYPSFGNWVKIPLDGFTVTDGVVYPVITSAGFDFKYTDICGSVQDFICGIYLSDEVIKNNPDIKVQLDLGLSETFEAAQRAEYTTVDSYTYNADDLKKDEHGIFGIGFYVVDMDPVYDDTYRIGLFAGIDSLMYREVGFKVYLNGKYLASGSTKNVYKKISASNMTLKAEDFNLFRFFGISVDFPTTYDNVEGLQFQPYAIDLLGNTIDGRMYDIYDIYTLDEKEVN